ncbi:unnamed protein product [Ectocarpus sp. 13 AM-2016]
MSMLLEEPDDESQRKGCNPRRDGTDGRRRSAQYGGHTATTTARGVCCATAAPPRSSPSQSKQRHGVLLPDNDGRSS